MAIQTFKLQEGTARMVVIRTLKPMGILLLVVGIINFGLIYCTLRGATGTSVWFFPLLLVMYAGIFGFIWFLISGFLIQANQNLVFKADDLGITRLIDLDGKSLSLLNQLQWSSLKAKNGQSTFIAWGQIGTILDKGHSIWLRPKGFSVISAKGQIAIPKEVEQFGELELLLKNKTGLSAS